MTEDEAQALAALLGQPEGKRTDDVASEADSAAAFNLSNDVDASIQEGVEEQKTAEVSTWKSTSGELHNRRKVLQQIM